ncbi:MAG: hypothetical protein AB7P21_30945 [Lautropia sp.]
MNPAIKIDRKIVAYRVEKPEDKTAAAGAGTGATVHPIGAAADPHHHPVAPGVVRMTEEVQRPEVLIGSTYKIKTPVSDHAMYVTINDIVLNEGTVHEQRRPFEIFINSKNLDHFQWIVALTRIMSAVFRKGGDVTFLVDELKAVFDPRGGYWQKGGRFMPSIIAELGHIIERHLQSIGLLEKTELDEHQKRLIAEKRAEFEARSAVTGLVSEGSLAAPLDADSPFPVGAQLCSKCNTAAAVMMDGCMTCLNCGESKCN